MLYDLSYLFLLFIIYSFLGWIIESTFFYLETKKIVNRGFLMGPYCPIFGIGALIMLLVLDTYKEDPINAFLMFVVYASILEYVTSYLMEKLFNARWWDYSHFKLNLNGRISLGTSVVFGILGLILGYLINPMVTNTLNFVSDTAIQMISLAFAIVFIIDMCITFNVVSKVRKNLVLLNRDMTEDINKQIGKFMEGNHFMKAFPVLKNKLKNVVRK